MTFSFFFPPLLSPGLYLTQPEPGSEPRDADPGEAWLEEPKREFKNIRKREKPNRLPLIFPPFVPEPRQSHLDLLKISKNNIVHNLYIT